MYKASALALSWRGQVSERKYQRLKQSLEDNPEFLQANPLKVIAHPEEAGKYVIIGGNMRRRALAALGYKDVPCAVLPPDTPAEKLRAYTILDNNNFGTWDFDAIAANWDKGEVEQWGLDIPDIVMETEEERREATEDDFTGDDIDEAPTRTHSGEVWRLGEHRLLVGDSTKEEDVQRLMRGEKADLLLTDPPYNVDYVKSKEALKKLGIGHKLSVERDIKNDNLPPAEFRAFLGKAFRAAAAVMRDGAAFYVWHIDHLAEDFRSQLEAAGLATRQTIIWYKNGMVIGHLDFQKIHEPCFYGWKGGAAHYFIHDRSQTTVYDDSTDYRKMDKRELLKVIRELTRPETMPTTVWREDKPQKSGLHPTMKPVRLFGRSVGNSTRQGEIVLDPFAGSGTAIIACEQLGRKCRAVELEPHYADAILMRWERLTGKRAIREEEAQKQ